MLHLVGIRLQHREAMVPPISRAAAGFQDPLQPGRRLLDWPAEPTAWRRFPYGDVPTGWRRQVVELRHVVAGQVQGKRSEDRNVYFKLMSAGVADVPAAKLAHDLARERGLGMELDFWEAAPRPGAGYGSRERWAQSRRAGRSACSRINWWKRLCLAGWWKLETPRVASRAWAVAMVSDWTTSTGTPCCSAW